MNTITIEQTTIEQTVEIPADRWLTIEVPREIPAGRVIVAFTPAPVEAEKASDFIVTRSGKLRKRLSAMTPEERAARGARDMEIINRNAERLNAEAMDVLEYQDFDL